ncbi:hypothetical protein LSTR_LSTR013022 [Laodelphax striatellus]|uniref:Odorant receptor n=1 Tax=Laodelphax striatellus TaxID=195883 RepID=A0A482WMK1_LAOST|nr:hypothetical protein LSTR_LSTR013022 [Laodelphax striatellus]
MFYVGGARMEYTKFLRRFLNLLRYDKPYNSLPILLLLFLTVMGLITISIAALEQKDVDISLEAIKDVVSIILVFVCIIEQSIYPERTLKLIRLIEDEFIVNRDELVERKDELWLEVGLLYERKRQDMRSKFQCLNWALFLIFCGYFSKHFLNQMVGIEAQSEENGQKRWPTPFLYPIPQTYSSSYLIYTYTIHVIMLASACYEGYVILITVSLSTEKVLADFETMYMLIEYVTKDFPDSSRNSYRESHRLYEETNISKSEANLRGDMAQLVRCHQIICRTKSCVNTWQSFHGRISLAGSGRLFT